MKWKNLMIDLETLDRVPRGIILSIAAVPFNWDGSYGNKEERFEINISLQDSLKRGFTINADTLRWWMEQSEEARKRAFGFNTIEYNLNESLYKFRQYLDSLGVADLEVWGNSNRFDLGLLAAYYNEVYPKTDLPWKYSNERDVRTLVSFYPEIKANTKFEGTPHNPIDDCIHQIKYCTLIKNSIKKIV